MRQNMEVSTKAEGQVNAKGRADTSFILKSIYEFECYSKDGELRWATAIDNIVVNVGLNDVLDKYFLGSAYTAAHYVGLKAAGTASAADTMSAHSSWTEITAYSGTDRPSFTPGAVSSQSVDNTASKAQFTMTTATSVAGAFLTTSSGKGSATGTLYAVADFSSARAVLQDDTVSIVITITAGTG